MIYRIQSCSEVTVLVSGVENLFRFQISRNNFSLPLPLCILFVFPHFDSVFEAQSLLIYLLTN